ncbi:MAG: methylmalonyl-CoA/ethylmalonyl-CoA epimerase [Bradyrhizobium sp.]|jgi:methylmalonyl-CoA/ethylmalonyl-CoA epimerase|nr:methylmalonyl-CoA/ethylmalonyl-CoA epimerase [Bradyrhizobium sp.]
METAVRPEMIFDHAGIVVRNLEKGLESLGSLLPIVARTARFDDRGLGVSVQFLRDSSGVVLELISPLGLNSPVAKVASSRVGVINQFAYRVADLASAGRHFRSKRAVPTGAPKPAIAFGGALVQFFYFPDGFIVELIEAPDFKHSFEEFKPA